MLTRCMLAMPQERTGNMRSIAQRRAMQFHTGHPITLPHLELLPSKLSKRTREGLGNHSPQGRTEPCARSASLNGANTTTSRPDCLIVLVAHLERLDKIVL